MFRSVRFRLTCWYVLAFGLLLGCFSAFLYAFFARDLYQRFDASLAKAAEATASYFQSEVAENGGNVATAAAETLSELRLSGAALAIFESGRALASTGPEIERGALSGNLLLRAKSGGTIFDTIPSASQAGARLAVMPVRADQAKCFVAVMEPLDSVAGQLSAVRRMFYLALPAALLLAGLGGYFLAKQSLAPVTAMAAQAAQISAQSLHERLHVENSSDELGLLAGVFNDLLSRLEQSFESMRRFMADASHELRTPLAIVQGEADVALSQSRATAEYRESLAVIQDEARRLSRLVDEMLDLARAEAGQRPLKVEEFYLNDLLEECCRRAQTLAQKEKLSLALIAPGDIPFRGDETLLREMTLNLLDNAIRYTPAGGAIRVKLERYENQVRIIVSDTGVGIPAEAAERVFERFYRVDKARSRSEGGSGLGLSIVKWVAEAHHGAVELVSEGGKGSTFTVSLPLQPDPAADRLVQHPPV